MTVAMAETPGEGGMEEMNTIYIEKVKLGAFR